ncbi:RICIN domain-containing protein [Microbacterium sp. 22296]|uniref:RICIN domain-containing protein n=1 Tax=Microbacterium sp. 22296 TaxID=3453903 RepID=UPI003F85C2D2
MKTPSLRRRLAAGAAALVTASVLLAGGATSAQAYNASGDAIVTLGSEPCLKGRGNCIVYPKSAQLPSGRLVMAFEKSTVAASGSADGQTMPVYKSDDDGTTWQSLSQVPAPAYASSDPKFAPYVSNWTNANLFVLPQDIGSLKAGTLLLASVVSGDDEYYKERKAADPSWVPSNDGDRSNIAIALYASTDEGASWSVIDIIARGGWQGGSAGNIGGAISAKNTTAQVDPVWEPHLEVIGGKLVAYYSDENDYLGFDPQTGVARIDPDNATAPDSRGQILVHKTWTGTGSWSEPVIDVPGLTVDRGNGKSQIGGGRPGMTTIAKTTDGKWMMTFEYFGGGSTGRYQVADDPLQFWRLGTPGGSPVGQLPLANNSRPLWGGGSPVLLGLPDGRIIFNSDGSGNIWVNESGRSDGAWVERQTPLGSGYSRNLQYVMDTGLVHILQATWGGATSGSVIRSADVDLGHSAGPYATLVNKKTGQVLGTGGNTTDANIGNYDQPDVRVEDPRTDASADTQLWHVRQDTGGTVTLLNKSGGREAAVWTGNATAGQRLGSWVDNQDGGLYRVITRDDGYVSLQSAQNSSLYVSAPTANGAVTLQQAASDGADQWKIVDATAPVDPSTSVSSSAQTRCIGKKVTLMVTSTNTGDAAVTAAMSSTWGSKTATLAAGATSTAAFSTRSASVPAGTAQVVVTKGEATGTITVPYTARSCS